MFVRLRFSAAAHWSHNSRTSESSSETWAAVFRKGHGKGIESTEFELARDVDRKPVYGTSRTRLTQLG